MVAGGRRSLLLLLLLLLAAVARATPTSQIERPPTEQDEDDDDDDDGADENFDYGSKLQNGVTEGDTNGDGDGNGEEDDETDGLTQDGYDVDYVVKRPTSAPPEAKEDPDLEHKVKECREREKTENYDGDEEEYRCHLGKDLTPYVNYKSYRTWQRRPLFIIIIGGLRWDYLTETTWNLTDHPVENMKAFSWIKKHGTTMQQVIPVFPPYDLPTWTSLATGLYPATTGVTGDYMFNLKTRELFSRAREDSLDSWWIQGEPIWSVAAKYGRKVSVLNWHDCTLPGRSIEDPKDCKPFTVRTPMPNKQKLVQLFNQAFTKIHKDKYDLSIVYTDVLKKTALQYGPNSPEVMRALVDLDDVFQGRLSDIKNKKERADLKLNIMIISDYGLNGRLNTSKLVLDDYMEFDHVQYIIQRGGSVVLVPYALKTGDILHGVGDKPGVSTMIGVDAYVRDVNLEVPPLEYPLIPDHLHYGSHKWTQDILLVAKPGFEIEIREPNEKILPPLGSELGTSGYAPAPPKPKPKPGRDKHKSKELRAREKNEGELYEKFAHMMKTVGFAWGPDFKPDYMSNPIEIVDLYQIIAFLLKIPPNYHDGSWERVRPMLAISGSAVAVPSLLLIFILCAVLVFSTQK